MKQLTTKMLRQRKMLLVLPALVIPFITMAFWALGGGKGSPNESVKTTSGLNLELPGAALKDDRTMDKLAYYDKAQSDSEKIMQQMKDDPYFVKPPVAADSILAAFSERNPSVTANRNSNQGYSNGYTNSPYTDPNETKVYQKLAQLNAALKSNGNTTASQTDNTNLYNQTGAGSIDVDRLEQMLQSATGNKSEDPEMKQLSGMLEKILDIQHPERVTEKLKVNAPVNKETIFSVNKEVYKSTFSLLDTPVTQQLPSPAESFFGTTEANENTTQNAIEAVVHETQTLVSGAVIKLRLCSPVYISEHCIPKGNFVFGTVTLNNERLEININSIREGNSLFPVKMEVYDMDGLAGIYIPGAISRDVAKQSTDNALQSVALGSLDPSIGAQAASAGIETAKNLLSKKVKLVKVQVKAGYRILLKDKQQ
ncbi:MAG: conjugative transposon protein TraM [Bacteroidetes bacterium]|nr:conjugative transposon protein TraM [Bacteroidota bacterium]